MQKTFLLTTGNIDAVSAEIQTFLKQQKQHKEHIIKACLSAETALLRWLESGYQNQEITLECKVKFGRPIVRLLLAGENCNPLEVSDDFNDYFNIIQANIGNIVTFQYARKTNIVEIKLPFKPFAMWKKNLVALVLAVITWAVIDNFIPSLAPTLNTLIITPTFKMLMGLLKALASFMIFFNVLDAICHMGNLDTLSKLGLKVMFKSQKANLVASLFITAICYFVFDVVSSGSLLNGDAVGKLYKVVLDIVPGSLVQPFIGGNTLQILFMSVCGGVLLLILGQQASVTFKFVNELNSLFMMAIIRCCSFIPLMVYLSFTSLLLSDKFGLLLSMWKIFAVVYGAGIVFAVSEFLYTAFSNGFKLKEYFSAISSLGLVAYTVASTTGCVPFEIQTLKDGNVHERYRDFTFPLCQILDKPGTIIGMTAVVLGLAEMAGIKLPLFSFIVIIFSIFLLAQTAPPVKGGTISVMILLFAQVNIPQEFIAPIVSVDYFFSMLRLMVNTTSIANTVFASAKDDGEMGSNAFFTQANEF